MNGLAGADPWLTLSSPRRFVQAYRNPDGAFLLEHDDGTGLKQTTASGAGEVAHQLWLWVNNDPAFGDGHTFSPVTLT